MAHFNLQPSSAGMRFWSHVPKRETPNVHDGGASVHVSGQKWSGFRGIYHVTYDMIQLVIWLNVRRNHLQSSNFWLNVRSSQNLRGSYRSWGRTCQRTNGNPYSAFSIEK